MLRSPQDWLGNRVHLQEIEDTGLVVLQWCRPWNGVLRGARVLAADEVERMSSAVAEAAAGTREHPASTTSPGARSTWRRTCPRCSTTTGTRTGPGTRRPPEPRAGDPAGRAARSRCGRSPHQARPAVPDGRVRRFPGGAADTMPGCPPPVPSAW
jgi:hypothetical protein